MRERPARRVDLADARRLAIAAQQLAGPRRAGGALEVVRRISYLQLDPTNVVARNPHQVLLSRLGTHDPAVLDRLLARRVLFETPSLILPASDLSIHAATMRDYRRATGPAGRDAPYGPGDNAGGGTRARYVRRWLARNGHLRRRVLSRLRRDGPLPLSAFEDRAVVSWTSGGWSDERNVSMLLAILQRRGEVIVAGRRRGQKLYAAADGWLADVRPLRGLALEREATRRSLDILQVATPKQLRGQYAFGRHVTARALAALERDGEVERVEVAGPDGPLRGVWYARPGTERRAREVREAWEPRTTLLSPFDNLIIDRDRTLALFGYFYRMEIYVPAAKRKLGYWAMPVLHGDRIVGSVDPRLDRERRELVVNRVVLAAGVPRTVRRAVDGAIEELARSIGAERVRGA